MSNSISTQTQSMYTGDVRPHVFTVCLGKNGVIDAKPDRLTVTPGQPLKVEYNTGKISKGGQPIYESAVEIPITWKDGNHGKPQAYVTNLMFDLDRDGMADKTAVTNYFGDTNYVSGAWLRFLPDAPDSLALEVTPSGLNATAATGTATADVKAGVTTLNGVYDLGLNPTAETAKIETLTSPEAAPYSLYNYLLDAPMKAGQHCAAFYQCTTSPGTKSGSQVVTADWRMALISDGKK